MPRRRYAKTPTSRRAAVAPRLVQTSLLAPLLSPHAGLLVGVQVLQAILKKKDDPTCISLIYCNQTEEDILLREDMEALAAANPDRFKIWYTVDRAGPEWKYSTGYINEAMVKEHLFPADPETIACMCGPPGMIKFACIPSLEKAGYDADHYFSF
jgi:NAD(P)H-flavin reductase